METRSILVLRERLAVMGNEVRETYLQAMINRIDVHLILADQNGAEAEDIPDIVTQAITSALPIVSRFMAELGEVDKAKLLIQRSKRK